MPGERTPAKTTTPSARDFACGQRPQYSLGLRQVRRTDPRGENDRAHFFLRKVIVESHEARGQPGSSPAMAAAIRGDPSRQYSIDLTLPVIFAHALKPRRNAICLTSRLMPIQLSLPGTRRVSRQTEVMRQFRSRVRISCPSQSPRS